MDLGFEVGMIGRVLAGRYVLVEVLGQGGMGVVWRAHDPTIGRDVAIKELRLPDYLDREEVERRSARMQREVRAAGRVRHPNVVTVFDVVVEDGRPWIVMQLLPGRPLTALIAEGPMAPERTARIGAQMLAGLAAVHRVGIEHRDVKPANVMVDEDGTVVLTDFGIATHPDSPSVTETGATAGTPEYMAPERAVGQPSGPSADLWSLGVTLYEMVEGRSPFRRDNPLATLQAVARGTCPPPLHTGPLAEVVVGLLRLDPAARMTVSDAAPLLAAASAGAASAGAASAGAASAGAASAGAAPIPGPDVVERTDMREPLPAGEVPAPAVGADVPPPRPMVPPVVGRPAPRGRSTRALVVLGAVVAVLLAAGGVTVGLLVGRDGPAGRDTAASPAAALPGSTAPVSASASASPNVRTVPQPDTPATSSTFPATPPNSAAPAGTPAAPDVPAGFRRVTHRGGFTVVVPTDWTTRDADGERIFYRSADDLYRLGVRPDASDAAGDPCAELGVQASKGLGPGTFIGNGTDYHQLWLTCTTVRGRPAGLWEFTWNNQGTVRRSINMRFVEHGRTWDFWVSGPETGSALVRSAFDAARDSFTPSG
ncbi:serine/threonine-protein kinase [Embleya sp. NBC_00896]|uniref:serine/threonine-protein kinase n=1 Tax=Embleya sp. NBC_00896 TaxID=2975961 RepID=UPI0038635C36|nr:serine/threonine protein kinase [Embleya sp. NBC_00896]